MTMSTLSASLHLETVIYDREIAAGKPDFYARAVAQAYVAGFIEAYEDSVATGYAQGRKFERERLGEMSRKAAVHGPEAQRWLMARELDIPAEALLVDGDPASALSDGSEPLPLPASCH